MPFSAGSFSLYSTGNPVVTGTTISSSWANNTLNDIATGLSTCLLKDGTQTVTANIPMGGFKFTGLAAGSASGNSLRYEQVNGVVTTAGDTLYATAAGTLARLAIGTARQVLQTNAGATAPEWAASPQSVLTTTGDLLYASAANTLARLAIGAAGGIPKVNAGATAPEYLAIGTARQALLTNAGATSPEWGASLQSLMTAQGDIVQASAANTPARLALGTANQILRVNAGATAAEWTTGGITLGTSVATTSGTEVDYTGIPSGTKRITIIFRGVSLSGTDNLLVQIGDAGGFETSAYISTASTVGTTVSSTAGFIMVVADAAGIVSGSMVLNLIDSATFAWVSSAAYKTLTTTIGIGGGGKALSAELTQVRITRTGTDTFDAGTVNLSYE